jgi:hypothetical protein
MRAERNQSLRRCFTNARAAAGHKIGFIVHWATPELWRVFAL